MNTLPINQPEFGRALRAAMKAQGVTQVALAEKFGVSQTCVNDWLDGATPKENAAEIFGAIAKVLGMSISGTFDQSDAAVIYQERRQAFADHLRALLQQRGIKARFLAAEVGVCKRTIRHYLEAVSLPTPEIKAKIADFFGAPQSPLPKAPVAAQVKYQIIGLHPSDPSSAYLLFRYTKPADVSKYGATAMLSMPTQYPSDVIPMEFCDFPSALRYIETETKAGSTWIYAVRPIFGA